MTVPISHTIQVAIIPDKLTEQRIYLPLVLRSHTN